MSEIKSLSRIPTVSLHGSEFYIELDTQDLIARNTCVIKITSHDDGDAFCVDVASHDATDTSVCEIQVTCADHEFSVSCRSQLNAKGKQCLVVSLPDIQIPSLIRVKLVYPNDSIDISDGFSRYQAIDITDEFLRYQLDKTKLNDNVYLTNTLFNASARSFTSDELFIITYAYLNVLPLNNQNFGGLITILCYRITDNLVDRGHILEQVYQTHRRYLDVVCPHDAVAFRWLVSSSSTLVTALLSVGCVTQAEDVLDSALKLIFHPSFNPLVHQNYALLLFQGGLIKSWNGCFDEAASLFIAAVNAGRYGMTDLLHPQNSWILGQLSDCYKFLHIIEAAYRAALACTRNNLPSQTRFSTTKTAPKLHMDYKSIFDRFACFKKNSPPFFEQVLHKLQTRQNGQ
ncbi:MAG: hypothetical protein K9L60_13215 [Methylovulum sp.]|jgi:hypothetical protein|nr:hypothetical protein [Methylovulum sp.]MCF7999977.1 hypothetical protein [Methylovulum sp.]